VDGARAAYRARSSPSTRASLVAFDLLHLDGEDLRNRPIENRRVLLAELLSGAEPCLQFSHEVEGDRPEHADA
jgi:bifunctional non-homologous end joining protein LigD